MPRRTTRVRCRDCATQNRVSLPPKTKSEVLCLVCGSWLHRPPNSKLPCPACLFDSDHEGTVWPVTPSQTVAETVAESEQQKRSLDGEPELPQREREAFDQRLRAYEDRRAKEGDTENTGCVFMLLFVTQAGASAVVSDACAGECPSGFWFYVARILRLGFDLKEWLLPGTGGLHESAAWVVNIGYLWLLAIVFRSIAATGYRALRR